ncbi:MAG: DUF4384 domain-containing protein [bacterium]
MAMQQTLEKIWWDKFRKHMVWMSGIISALFAVISYFFPIKSPEPIRLPPIPAPPFPINLEEIRSAIVAADGYAYLAGDKTINQLRDEAKSQAMRNAVERGKIFIQSLTRVENFVLHYDLIKSESAGYLSIIEEKDYGIESDNRYHYWIKGEVRYGIKEKSVEPLPFDPWQNPHAPLTVRVWTDTTHYTDGQFMLIYLQGNKEFYARVVYHDVQGNLIQLLPNQFRGANYFKGGQMCEIPDAAAGDLFQLRVRPPFGAEEIIVYASTAKPGSIDMTNAGQGLYQFRGSVEDLGRQTRGVEIIGASAEPGKAEFYEARWKVITSPQAYE